MARRWRRITFGGEGEQASLCIWNKGVRTSVSKEETAYLGDILFTRLVFWGRCFCLSAKPCWQTIFHPSTVGTDMWTQHLKSIQRNCAFCLVRRAHVIGQTQFRAIYHARYHQFVRHRQFVHNSHIFSLECFLMRWSKHCRRCHLSSCLSFHCSDFLRGFDCATKA